MKLVNFRRSKSAVGHEHVNVKKIEIGINHQLIKIIYLNQDLKLAETALLGDRWRSDKHDPGDRHAVPRHQGGAVVPANDEVSHEEIRPETHLLVRTERKEVSRLIYVG